MCSYRYLVKRGVITDLPYALCQCLIWKMIGMCFEFVFAFLICIIVPILVGDLFIPHEAFFSRFIMGILATLAVSQVLFLPFIIYQHHFTPYYWAYILIIGVLCVISVVKRHKSYHQRLISFLNVKENIGEINIWMVLAIVLIGVQVIRVAVGHFFVYADNAHYIPVINDLIETDKDYYLDFILGAPGAHETSIKYLFTTYFPYLASISKLSGLHPAILVQTLLPIILTVVLYVLVWQYGLFLFNEKKSSWMFVFFFCVLVETAGGYDFTFANHAVSGIYFGKKIVFTILLPYIMLFIAKNTSLLENEVTNLKRKDVLLLIVMIIGVCAPSLMGTGLAPIILFALGIVLAVRKKSLVPFFQMIVSMLPSLVFLMMAVAYLYF